MIIKRRRPFVTFLKCSQQLRNNTTYQQHVHPVTNDMTTIADAHLVSHAQQPLKSDTGQPNEA